MFANVFASVSHLAKALYRMGDSINRLTDSLDGLAGKIEANADEPLVLDVAPVNRISNGKKAVTK